MRLFTGFILLIIISSNLLAALPVQNGVLMHLDADSITGVSNGQAVTAWNDISRNNNDASVGVDAVDDPIYIASAINSLPAVEFGASNSYFTFPALNNIRTVFWVCKEDSSATFNRFLLGGSTTWDFHRGQFAFWDVYWASSSVYNGTTRLNGSSIDATTVTVPDSYSIVSLVTTGNVSADQLTRDRTNGNASWHGEIAEVIIYNRPLNDTEENEVGVYLSEKYGITTTYEAAEDPEEPVVPCDCIAGVPCLIYDGANYSVWLDDKIIEIKTPSGGTLTRWPVGTTVTATDHDQTLEAVPTMPTPVCTTTTDNGTEVVAWTWQFAEGAISEQVETLKFYDNYVAQDVKVEWRNAKPTLWRVVYGGSLASGCYDLEGVWRRDKETPDVWLPEPVPGYFADAGTCEYKKTVKAPPAPVPTDMRIVLGGVDDEDITYYGSTEVGRTPLNYGTGSWNLERRYPISSSLIVADSDQVITVTVPNTGGYGGIWKTPCVMGPASVLSQTATNDGWTRATAQGQTMHTWCPDANSNYEKSLTGRFTVSLSSQDRTIEIVPENITTGGRFQIPPYVVAIDGTHGFWGIGTLEMPRSEDGLRVEYRNGSLTCPFLLKTGDPSESGLWTQAPQIGIFIGSSKETIMDNYLAALPPKPVQQRPDWWTGPEYCTWGDQVYYDMLYGGGQTGVLTNARVRGWLSKIKTLGMTFPQVTLDAGWWQLSTSIVDEIHADGQHAVLWTQPHWGPVPGHSTSWGVKDTAGRVIYGSGGTNIFLDFTQAAVRTHTEAEFGNYFTGWDADGIKLDFAYVSKPIWNVMADESWGAGEQYRARVLEYIYQIVQNNKADGFLSGACANPLFGEVQSLCRLNEEWTSDPQTYRRRAKATLASGEWIMSDDWNAYEHYLPHVLVERSVWGCPTIQSVDYRGDVNNNAIALSTGWAKRIKAVTYLASLATIKSDQKIAYDADDNISRTTATGATVAAALPLNGQSSPSDVLVISTAGRFLVASMANGSVDIPTPVAPYKAYSVAHDGSRSEVAFTQGSSEITLDVTDAAGAVWYYEVITCDFDGDASIGIADLGELASGWTSVSDSIDVTGDGKVDADDFVVLFNQWLQP